MNSKPHFSHSWSTNRASDCYLVLSSVLGHVAITEGTDGFTWSCEASTGRASRKDIPEFSRVCLNAALTPITTSVTLWDRSTLVSSEIREIICTLRANFQGSLRAKFCSLQSKFSWDLS
jgi:hypothetical protein